MHVPGSSANGQNNDSLIQTIDIPLTLLDWFKLEPTARMQGHSLFPVAQENKNVETTPFLECLGAMLI